MVNQFRQKRLHKKFGLSAIITAGVVAAVFFVFDTQQDFAKETINNNFSINNWENKILIAKLPINEDIESLDELKEFQIEIEFEPEILGLSSSSTIILAVPFAPQAPFGEWSDPRQDYGCEEASLLMTWHYINDLPLSLQTAKNHVIEMSDWEERVYGEYKDSSSFDTVERFKAYFNYDEVRLAYDIGIDDIKKELLLGNPVIVPVNGRVLDNPFYTPPGPPHHMLVVVGFDDETEEFITNDPGTKNGYQLRYTYDNFYSSIRDYPTGHNEPVSKVRSAMIVIEQQKNSN
jgi:hypothetical protein